MTADEFRIGQMGGSVPELRFTVPGKVATNNTNARLMNGAMVKNATARLYQSRVAQYALVAARTIGWRFQPCVRISIVHWNGLIDWDNVPKSIVDAMKGIVYPDDRRRYVRGGGVDTDVDGGEEYVEIIVRACDPLPEIVRRKCGLCLDSRPGVRAKPFICGRCSQRRKKAAA